MIQNPENIERLMMLLMTLRRHGITDTKLLSAVESVPPEILSGVEEDEILEHLKVLQSLDVSDRHMVLEVGTGAGLRTVLLSKLARRVYTLELDRARHDQVQEMFSDLGYDNISALQGNGCQGWPQISFAGPAKESTTLFDRIVVNAAGSTIPEPLVAQLKPDGILIMPLVESNGDTAYFNIQHQSKDLGDDLAVENLFASNGAFLVEDYSIKA